MRELTEKEIEQVSGGFGPAGALIAGAVSGTLKAASGASAGEVVAATTLGAVSGFFGGIASVTTGITRVMFSAYAIETGFLSGLPTS